MAKINTNTILLHHPLFNGISEEKLQDLLKLMQGRKKKYDKNQTIFLTGTKTEKLGFILEGRVQIESTDFWGNKTILDSLGPGKVFAETYALTGEPLMVDVVCTEKTNILFLTPSAVLENNKSNQKIFSTITKNLLQISMNKNLHLSKKIFFTSPRKIRDRLLTYLSSFVNNDNSSGEVEIPLNRQQLADYLQVDRTSLSAELSNMKEDGLIDYWKNHFKLLQ